ncbi:Crp/Fnr family transcriptional regulator [Methylorubrum extorquens]
MSQPQQETVRNRLLKALTPDDFALLAPTLEAVPIALRQTLIESHQTISHAYFIKEGLASVIARTPEGRIEIASVGFEGLIGTSLVLGTQSTPHNVVVQGEGTALRIATPALRAALRESEDLRGVFGRYVQSLFVQAGQTLYANAELTIEGRLARWILMIHDRLRKEEVLITHDFMALMLGVRRSSVTIAVHMLEGAHLIKAKRGRVRVLDREGLMEMAGGTYGVAETEYERLLEEARGGFTHASETALPRDRRGLLHFPAHR